MFKTSFSNTPKDFTGKIRNMLRRINLFMKETVKIVLRMISTKY